ncbi:MAG: hypothetical protein AMJ46_04130 [Latescibacteria bacterium DG_63]|nr:MAG: hypothetical protein AMJ46_04130 [Latescibacteria bacterium DG_63]
MTQGTERAPQSSTVAIPDVGWSYSNGWHRLWKYFLELLLVSIVLFLFSIPSGLLEWAGERHGAGAAFLWLFSIAYGVLLLAPIEYGAAFAFLRAAQGKRVEVKDMFEVFKNYVNAVLANILVYFIVGVGFILLIIPGIIFACKLAFVPYLVVEQKMYAVEAVKESWRMTSGHAVTVFLIGLLSIPIAMVGLLCFIVGIIPAVMWIRLAFASLYHAVSENARRPVPQPIAPMP